MSTHIVQDSGEQGQTPPQPAKPQESLWHRFLASPATWVIAGLNIAVFAAVESQGRTTDSLTLLRFGALERYHVWSGEYWRLATCMFLHIGVIHLIWNVYALPSWCSVVERSLGSWKFLMAYLLTGIGASATSLLCHHTVAAGASGAGFGMIGVVLVIAFVRLGGWKAFMADLQVKQSLAMIAVWVILGFTMMPMDNYAHLGGLAFGIFIGCLLMRVPKSGQVAKVWWIVFGVLWVGLVAAAIYPRNFDRSLLP